MKKMIEYVLILSKTFPATHPRKGEQTEFGLALKNTLDFWRHDLAPLDMLFCKLHTIRANYLLWKKRFEKIERGEACLSIRQWEGKPRHSKTIEIARLTKEDGIGLQKLEFETDAICPLYHPIIDGKPRCEAETLAANDGLCFVDWQCWFDQYDLSQPMAIIHFSKFRY